ncbi:hypothetical protein SDRG_13150 [Saprolegnia diclina VS20]|uniref:Uncharacterized protein n=1 Tax=Saprolegnia diclina (strain VS20) TaxID=1156394 RepID=T0PUC7_SAPDV|nr:hypothetical protein SDRG_13150 [Saprolegnia diclina VS20]EQC29119.1 hypothetical protein SDRG_13150 [Saprolegnia diclina VS20]|eukprot:XP_008617454.1 hypothetical protein SDRG_13150 [Saprolegnia diclina VS20]
MATTQKELGQMDLQERVSYIQSATKDKDADGDYTDAKTPGELEDGALVAGGALSLASREALALFSQYFAIGILYGMLPGMQYSVFQNYLKMEGYQLAALGWLFLLPPQKEAMQALKKRGQTSKLAGALLVIIFFLALTFSVTTNFLSVYPSTKCLRIAGGKGRKNGTCIVKK